MGRYERGEMAPSVEVAKKLADTFDVMLNYLVDDTRAGPPRSKTRPAPANEGQKTIVHVLDSLLRDAKAKKAYAPQ